MNESILYYNRSSIAGFFGIEVYEEYEELGGSLGDDRILWWGEIYDIIRSEKMFQLRDTQFQQGSISTTETIEPLYLVQRFFEKIFRFNGFLVQRFFSAR